MIRTNRLLPGLLAGAALATAPLPAQVPDHWTANSGRASQVLIPQSHAIARRAADRGEAIRVEAVRARVHILETTATTELDILLRNPAGRQAEAVLLLPVPRGAAVGGFDFDGAGDEPSARILPADEARATYDSIVRRLKDPALLEFAGNDLVRSSVFPVPAGGTQRVRLRYEHLLERDGARVDYVLPRSESLARDDSGGQRAPWDIDVDVAARGGISTVFSPSHELATRRLAPDRLSVRVADASRDAPGSFRLSYLQQDGERLSASLFAYPDPSAGGGYFLLMAGLPQHTEADRQGLRREVTIVLDRSGSMAGGKLDQARAAALQVIEGLGDTEAFQIVDYSSNVARFAPVAVPKRAASVAEARSYLAALRPSGGTNIYDALLEALRPAPTPDSLGIVLFLTDGLPTVGRTRETEIRGLVETANPHGRRVFTFGVGHDVHAPLLDRVAEVSRATSTYVEPAEDVEQKVAQVFAETYGPVLSDLELRTLAADGSEDTRRIRDQQPGRLQDLFEDDQLVVLGRYVGDAPLSFELAGDWLGQRRRFAFRFALDKATTRNAFVPRLWASRRIAELVDGIRQAGAESLEPRLAGGADPFHDPHLRELRDEILDLSTRFGVLSEYTAFLATEGTDLGDWGNLARTCATNLDGRAMQTRWGIGATNQAANLGAQRAQTVLNHRNAFLDAQMNRVEVRGVQQVCDRAFFRRGARWIDGRLVQEQDLQPTRTVRRGSPEHEALLERLQQNHRGGVLSLPGEILTRVDGEIVLVVD